MSIQSKFKKKSAKTCWGKENIERNTSISLVNHFESTVSNGIFNNASEVVRAGLRLLEEEENRIIALRKAIQEGIDSGIAEDFEPNSFWSI